MTRIWLISCIIMLLILIFVGGITRLTESGLSITSWDVFTGILPPFNNEGWQILFADYKKIPEFQQKNFTMDLEGFKKIFWLEYLHRLIARIIFLLYLIPLIFFYFTKQIKRNFAIRILFITTLILFQGFLGWYMVTSGLKDNIDVSHFRLAIHLVMALIILGLTLTTLLSLDYNQIQKNPSYHYGILLTGILILQIIYGAFVSGLNAGLIYNNFPLMGENLIPQELFYMKSFLQDITSNPVTIQFIHRNLAFLFLFALCLFIQNLLKSSPNKEIKNLIKIIVIITILQITLGITTLLTHVMISFAALHQMIAILLFILLISLTHLLKYKKA